jgi:hypothetical protein
MDESEVFDFVSLQDWPANPGIITHHDIVCYMRSI